MKSNCTAGSVGLEQVRAVLIDALGAEPGSVGQDAAAPLLGTLPELDSMGIVVLLHALEEHFEVGIDDDDVSVELFETLGSLAALVEAKLG
jgi:acyl carrier protein